LKQTLGFVNILLTRITLFPFEKRAPHQVLS